jgi:hypothetical protein
MYQTLLKIYSNPADHGAGTIGLGAWDVRQGIRMRTTETDFPKWSLNILLPVGSEFEYKYVVRASRREIV